MIKTIIHFSRHYLDPFYQDPSQSQSPKEPLPYRFCALTNITSHATSIQNRSLRYIAQFFALCLDATIGCGLIGTLLYNAGAFFYNHSSWQDEARPWKWNATALKTWGIVATLAGIGLLYHFGKQRWKVVANPPEYPKNPTSPLQEKLIELSKCQDHCRKHLVNLRSFAPFDEISEESFLKAKPALFPVYAKLSEGELWQSIQKLEFCKTKAHCWELVKSLLTQPKFN